MDPDQELCLCFHVTLRKVQKFIRLEKPKVASQLSQCYGAGTGCGWCRPFLKRLLEEAQSASADRSPDLEGGASLQTDSPKPPQPDNSPVKSFVQLDPDEYASLREEYVRQGKGAPPR